MVLMEMNNNGHSPKADLLDRLLELRSQGVSYSRCATTLLREEYTNPHSGEPYTSQGLQQMARHYEVPKQVVFEGGDVDDQIRLFLQVLLIGSRQPGRSGEIFQAALDQWHAAIQRRKGRVEAAREAAAVVDTMRKQKTGGTKAKAKAVKKV